MRVLLIITGNNYYCYCSISRGKGTYPVGGANAPTAKIKFSANHLTITTYAPPRPSIMHPHVPTWKRDSSSQLVPSQ
jgi:hypothetical protein